MTSFPGNIIVDDVAHIAFDEKYFIHSNILYNLLPSLSKPISNTEQRDERAQKLDPKSPNFDQILDFLENLILGNFFAVNWILG